MSPEQKKKRQESTKRSLDKQLPEKKEELRQKARDYQKNIYQNHIVQVKE